MNSRHIAAICASALSALACGGATKSGTQASDASASGTTATQMIGPSGGSIRLGTHVFVTVPAGALGADTRITIERSTAASPPGAESGVYRFGPDGITFSRPVTVSFTVLGARAASIHWTKADTTNEYEPIPTTITGTAASAEVTHFSSGYVGAQCVGVPDGTACRDDPKWACSAGKCLFDGKTCTEFTSAVTFEHTEMPGPLAVLDFNLDGHKDIAVVSLWAKIKGQWIDQNGGPANTLTIYYGDGTGRQFTRGPTASTGDYPHSLEVGHGLPGISPQFLLVATSNPTDTALNVFDRALGGGIRRTDYWSQSPRVGDSHALVVDQPGFFVGTDWIDAAAHLVDVSYYGAQLRNVYLPDRISPDAAVRGNTSPTCPQPTHMASGDFDADGFADVLLACPKLGGVEVHYFAHQLAVGYLATKFFAPLPGPHFVAVGENGRFFVASNYDDSSISVFVRKPGGEYSRTDYRTPSEPFGMAISDFNGDGSPDLAVGFRGGISFFFGSNTGDRVPGGARLDWLMDGLPAPVAADLNGDGFVELVAQSNGYIMVIRNTCH